MKFCALSEAMEARAQASAKKPEDRVKGLWDALEAKKNPNERCPETGNYPLHELCGGRFWRHEEECAVFIFLYFYVAFPKIQQFTRVLNIFLAKSFNQKKRLLALK